MKRIFFLFLIFYSCTPVFSQSVSADLFFSNGHLEDLAGNNLDATSISHDQVVKILVSVHNGNGAGGSAAPAGHFRIKIGLGSGMVLNPGFNLGTAPLNSYFNWFLDMTGAQPQIVGTSISPLPADFVGIAVFELKAATSGTSTVSYNLLIANPVGTTTPLSDPHDANNIASNEYLIADILSFTTTVDNVKCMGGASGTITVNAVGGISPYNYTILNTTTNATVSNTTGIFPNLTAATYTITVTDNYGNIATGNETVTQPSTALINAFQSKTNIVCYGSSTGSITVAASGGTPGYVYAITSGPTVNSSGASSGVFSGLLAGTYTITATDTKGCTAAVSNISLTQPSSGLSGSLVSKTNVNCFGASTGTITISVSNGTPNYSYTIIAGTTINTTGAANGAFTGLAAGVYTIRITDASGCTSDVVDIPLTQPSSTLVNSLQSQTNISCYSNSTGSISVSASGGTSGYTYTIAGPVVNTTGVSSGTFINLSAGTYSITATDANGCTSVVNSIVLTQPAAALLSSLQSKTNINCFGNTTGSISISASGGTPNYTFTLSGPTVNTTGATTGTFTNLSAGTYSVSVTDNKGCTSVVNSIELQQPASALVNAFVSKINNACHNGSNGQIIVSASGGSPAYSYAIVSGTTINTSGASSGTFVNLAAGTYSITVTDANGCTSTISNIVITQPPGSAPDVILSVADYTDNFFPVNNTDITLIYQLTEIGGNPALNDLIRITKQQGYTLSLPAVSSVTVGSGINAITYTVDNNRWTTNNSGPVFFTLSINSGAQIDCGKSVYLAVKLSRTTPNKSVFSMTSVLQTVTGETVTNNNSTTVVLVGQ